MIYDLKYDSHPCNIRKPSAETSYQEVIRKRHIYVQEYTQNLDSLNMKMDNLRILDDESRTSEPTR